LVISAESLVFVMLILPTPIALYALSTEGNCRMTM
jgi:hypothetical protein